MWMVSKELNSQVKLIAHSLMVKEFITKENLTTIIPE